MKKTKVYWVPSIPAPCDLLRGSSWAQPLTHDSVMESSHARGVKTTASSAQLVRVKRQNTSNCLEGMPFLVLASCPVLLGHADLHGWETVMPRFWRTPSLPS